MRDVKHNRWFDKNETREGEYNDGPELVETDTYVPFKRQIADVMLAGKNRLDMIRQRNAAEAAQALLYE